MQCPSCHFEQPDTRLDCECCGLIFAKWRERHPPPEAETTVAPPQDGDLAQAPSPETATPDTLPPEESNLFVGAASTTESGIPDRPADEHLSNEERPRLYEQIAALDFQRD